MRTMEISDDLFEAAAEEARRRGGSLREFVEGAVATTLRHHQSPATGHRVDFPTIRSAVPGTFRLTNEDIRRMDEEDDLRMLGMLD